MQQKLALPIPPPIAVVVTRRGAIKANPTCFFVLVFQPDMAKDAIPRRTREVLEGCVLVFFLGIIFWGGMAEGGAKASNDQKQGEHD